MSKVYVLCQVTTIGEGEWPVPYTAYDNEAQANEAMAHMEKVAAEEDYMGRELSYYIFKMELNPTIDVLDEYLEQEAEYYA